LDDVELLVVAGHTSKQRQQGQFNDGAALNPAHWQPWQDQALDLWARFAHLLTFPPKWGSIKKSWCTVNLFVSLSACLSYVFSSKSSAIYSCRTL